MEYYNTIPIPEIRTIFLDYDGTLHDSLKIYAHAFKKAYGYLVKEGLAEDREWTDKEISYWLGFNAKDMWKNFKPDLGPELQKYCSNLISTEMRRLIEEGEPVLYEDALKTLAYLKEKGYHLVFISNCNIYYLENHRKLFGLDRYFEEFICSEEYDFKPKHEILKSIKHRYEEKMVIIGDRRQDMEAGWYNGIYTIGCKYGFGLKGELKDADIIIDRIGDLINIF
jgi:phosphoglycolate phosphatase